MKVLVTVGAGYIGGFMTKRLLSEGYGVVVVDSLERGHKSMLDKRAQFLLGNVCNKDFVSSIFENSSFDAVIHFAGFISMGESMENPYIYFANNTFGSLNIIEQMVKSGNNNFIFSSSAGVYGNPSKIPISETHTTSPENPYGESKLMVEKVLHWYAKTSNLKSVSLRYFNAAGAAPDGSIGEDHIPETHIIPNIINAALENNPFLLFGTDYKTKDGTCIRDYIHVLDLVEAHVLALRKLQKEPGVYTYNVGTGEGHSNRDVIDMVKRVSGISLTVEEMNRRLGDADILIADPTKIKKELKFIPKHSDLQTIVESAWKWHKRNLEFGS